MNFNTELIQVKHQQFTRSGATFRNFWVFTNQPGPPTILGIIQYDPDQELLTIKNPGFIAKGCLLLGGGNKENDPKCAGKFGEGLKLAILALLRLDRNQLAPATSAAASASSQPPRPPLERQSSGEPVVSAAAAAASAKAPPLVTTNFGGLPARANPNKMTVKVITPMGKDTKKSEKWDFWLQKAAGFPAKDGKDEQCVFFESAPVAFDPAVTVQVFGLRVSDWNAQIRNYRRLTDQTKWCVRLLYGNAIG